MPKIATLDDLRNLRNSIETYISQFTYNKNTINNKTSQSSDSDMVPLTTQEIEKLLDGNL